MREIVLDTETTGLDPFQGHRLVEIGCIELLNRIPTGQTFHRYLNPERDMPEEAFAVHGLTDGFLKDKPLFAEVADELVAFRSPAASIPAAPTGSTICARAMRSTIPVAPSMAHCSMPSCWRKSMSS
jgi:DNA polymerase III epsilon subunit-like protein